MQKTKKYVKNLLYYSLNILSGLFYFLSKAFEFMSGKTANLSDYINNNLFID